MTAKREFEAVIEEGRAGGALVVVPFDVPEVYGARRVPVKATFDGISYRGSIVSMGGRFALGIVKKPETRQRRVAKTIDKLLGGGKP